MPKREIYIPQSDIEAAHRIALKMWPELPSEAQPLADEVLAMATMEGMNKLKVVWEDG